MAWVWILRHITSVISCCCFCARLWRPLSWNKCHLNFNIQVPVFTVASLWLCCPSFAQTFYSNSELLFLLVCILHCQSCVLVMHHQRLCAFYTFRLWGHHCRQRNNRQSDKHTAVELWTIWVRLGPSPDPTFLEGRVCTGCPFVCTLWTQQRIPYRNN